MIITRPANFIQPLSKELPNIKTRYNFDSPNLDAFFKTGLEEINECFALIKISKSPQDYAKSVLKMTYNHPEQAEILWGLYRRIGQNATNSGGWNLLGGGATAA